MKTIRVNWPLMIAIASFLLYLYTMSYVLSEPDSLPDILSLLSD